MRTEGGPGGRAGSISTIPGSATGFGCPGRAITGAGAIGLTCVAVLMTGGLGRYMGGSGVLDGLLRSSWAREKTLGAGSDKWINSFKLIDSSQYMKML